MKKTILILIIALMVGVGVWYLKSDDKEIAPVQSPGNNVEVVETDEGLVVKPRGENSKLTNSEEKSEVVEMEVDVVEDLIDLYMKEFYKAVENKDFSDFYAYLSEGFAKSTSPEDLADSFSVYFDKEFLLDPINDGEYTFEQAVSEDGGEYQGRYETETRIVTYDIGLTQHDAVKDRKIRRIIIDVNKK